MKKNKNQWKGDKYLMMGTALQFLLPGTGIGSFVKGLAWFAMAQDVLHNPELWEETLYMKSAPTEEDLVAQGWIHPRNGEFRSTDRI